jgi:hypothetical protein
MKKSVAPAKPAPRHDKYFLRDLHQEIDFYDRKLAHMSQFAEFASPEDRELAEKGLRAKRAPLEKTALALVASGVKYDEKDLPRSFRTMNLEHDLALKNLTLVKGPKRAAVTQAVSDGELLT